MGKRANPVREAIEAVGSVMKVAALVDSTPPTVYAWLEAGRVIPARACGLLARAWATKRDCLGTVDELRFARRLAGLEP